MKLLLSFLKLNILTYDWLCADGSDTLKLQRVFVAGRWTL